MKQALILTGLLGISLLGSYLTWTADTTEPTEDGVAVYAAKDLTKIDYKSENSDVIIEKRSHKDGDYTWVTVTDRKRIKKPVTPPPAPAEPEEPAKEGTETEEAEEKAEEAPPEPEVVEEVESTTTQFRGNDTSDKLWEAFSPLMALRTLNTDPNAESLGFSGDKSGSITITQNGEAVNLTLGGETYGGKDRYLNYQGTIFLVDDKHLRSVSSAKARLVERRLHPLAEKEIRAVSITLGDQKTTLVQKNADDRAAAFWSREGKEEEDSAAGTWLGKLFRLKVQTYEEENPELILTPVFQVNVSGDDGQWTADVFRTMDDSNPDYYAKSSFNQALVKLTKSLASDAAEDISSIFDVVTVSP